MQPSIGPALARAIDLGHVGLASLAGARSWLVALLFVEAIALLLYWLR